MSELTPPRELGEQQTSDVQQNIVTQLQGDFGLRILGVAVDGEQQLLDLIENAGEAEIKPFANEKYEIGRLAVMIIERSLSEDGRTGRKVGIFCALEDGSGITKHQHTDNAEVYVAGNRPLAMPDDSELYYQQVCRVGEEHGVVDMRAGDVFLYSKVGADDPKFEEYIPPELQSITHY